MAKGTRGGKRVGATKNDSGFTEAEGRAIENYVSGEGMWINDYFRTDGRGQSEWGNGYGPLTQGEQEYVKNLDSALNKTGVSDTLYRSVDASAIFGNDVDLYDLESEVVHHEYSNGRGTYSQRKAAELNAAIDSTIGKTITEKGYMSTTRSEEIAADFGSFTGSSNPIVMKIKTSKSTKGADVSSATEGIRRAERSDPQKETLLARNQSYVVDKVYSKNGMVYVDVHMT